MIKSFQGKLIRILSNSVVVDFSGIGIEIHTNSNTLSKINSFEFVHLYIHTHIAEAEFKLAGFLAEEELNFYEDLLKVNRVGFSTALKIMESDINLLKQLIADLNDKELSKLPGIGKQSALDIIDKLSKKYQVYKSSNEVINKVFIVLEEMGILDDYFKKSVLKAYRQNPELSSEQLIRQVI